MVVGPAVDRMIEIVRPRIEGDLFQAVEVEPGAGEDVGIGLLQNRQRAG
jgi:hypothetical protein